MSTLHVSIDESGNFNFSPSGTRYYGFTAVWTFDPAPLAAELTRLRFALLKNGNNLQAFHATEDKQQHRDRVVQTLTAFPTWRFASVLIEKAKVNPAIRDPAQFYPKFLGSILRFIFRGSIVRNASGLLIYTDALPIKKKRESVEKAIKTAIASELHGIPFEIFHHKKESNCWIQVADYCMWATFRKWEGNDDRTYRQLRAHLHAPELDALRLGMTLYY